MRDVALAACVAGEGGVVTVWAVGRILRSPPLPMSIAITFLPYLVGALVVAGVLAWVAAPRSIVPPIVLLGALVLGTASSGQWPHWEGAAEGRSVRVLEWNVRRFWGGPDGESDPFACVVEAARRERADVSVWLEVSANDVERLAAELGVQCIHGDYEGTGLADVGGIAVCARPPFSVTGSPDRFVDDDPWQYVFAEVRDGKDVLNVLAVHLHPYRLSFRHLRSGLGELVHGDPDALVEVGRSGRDVVRAQGAQARALEERVTKLRDPTVIAGDFNSTSDHALHVALRGRLQDVWMRRGEGLGGTIDFSGLLPLRIDYVYATDDFAVTAARVLPASCSDHRPVVADVVLVR